MKYRQSYAGHNGASPKNVRAHFPALLLGAVCVLLSPAAARAQSPRIALSAATLAFGTVEVEHTKVRVLTIRNTGKATLTGNVPALQAPFAITSIGTTSTNSGSFSIAAGGKLTVSAQFSPQTTGSSAPQTFVIASNDPKHPSIPVKLTGAGHATINVTSVSTNSPTPLTTVILTTKGLKPGQPVSVTFSNSAGFLVADTPIRVEKNGTVAVAVPMYIDPVSNTIGAGQVSLELSQKNSACVPISLNIQNLPPLSAYGTQLGQISHAFLVFQATLLGKRLGQLQAAQALLGVDTSAAQATVSSLLTSTILSRNDVDRIILNNSTIAGSGTLADGTPVQFDQTSVDLMDRLIAVALIQQFGSAVQPSSQLGLAPSIVFAPASLADTMDLIIPLLQNNNSIASLVQGAQEGLRSESGADTAYALIKGAAPLIALAALGAPAGLALAGGIAVIDISLAYTSVYADQQVLDGDLKLGAKSSVLQGDVADLKDANVKALFATLDGFFATSSPLAELGQLNVLQGTIEGLSLISTTTQIAQGQGFEFLGSTDTTVASDLFKVSKSPLFGDVSGTANVQDTQGVAAAQSGLDLCCFGANQLGIVGVADPSGSFDLEVPLNVPGTDYTNLTLSLFDPSTQTTLNSETVDLSGLDTSTPVQVPVLTGTCNDSDASSPDGDDPDCD